MIRTYLLRKGTKYALKKESTCNCDYLRLARTARGAWKYIVGLKLVKPDSAGITKSKRSTSDGLYVHKVGMNWA